MKKNYNTFFNERRKNDNFEHLILVTANKWDSIEI